MEASIHKLLLLEQKDIQGSLWFVGLVYCLELCGLKTFLYLTGWNGIFS